MLFVAFLYGGIHVSAAYTGSNAIGHPCPGAIHFVVLRFLGHHGCCDHVFVSVWPYGCMVCCICINGYSYPVYAYMHVVTLYALWAAG